MLLVEERYYTVPEIANRLRVHQDTVRAWLQAGDLKGIRLAGRRAGWRISERDLREFLEKRRGEPSDRG